MIEQPINVKYFSGPTSFSSTLLDNYQQSWSHSSTSVCSGCLALSRFRNSYLNIRSCYQALSKLPIQVHGHTMVTCNDRLYLIGGDYDGSGQSDKIWEGTLISNPFKIIWKELGFRLQKKRKGHFSFVISNTIIIFGGRNILDDFVEIIEDNKLRQGARVPFELNTFNDPAVLDRKNRVIITSKKYGLIVYDHQNEFIQDHPNVKLRKEQNRFATVIQ